MPRKTTWWSGLLGLGLAVLAPAAVRAQAAASMAVSATVMSAEGTRSWQAVAARLAALAPASKTQSTTLATIAERTERTPAGERRVVSVEYLRN